MREELEKRLEEAFVFMKKKRSSEEQMKNGMVDDLYSAFGCDFGDGWFDLIFDLCTEIDEVYKREKTELDIEILQIKEKFGTLRFYYTFKGSKPIIPAIDFLGSGSVRCMHKDNPIHKEIADIVSKYEKKSGTVCEKCGAPGKLRTELRWIYTLCDDCHNERMSKRK